MDKVDHLKQLGSKETVYTYDNPTKEMLETFPNQNTDRNFSVELICNEMTSLCPRTKQPDFAIITISYIPDLLCVETKSLKLYLFAFRNHGSFMETIVNKILDDLVAVCSPREMTVIGDFNIRGGIALAVTASYKKS